MNKLVKLLLLTASPYYAVRMLSGVAAGVEHTTVLSDLARFRVRSVVDVGASRGQFAIVARRCFPGARIISFEPLVEPASIFKRVFAGDPQTVLHAVAIGPREVEADIHVSRADDSSSLLPFTTLQDQLFPGTAEKELRTIEVRPLDAVLSADDIQKPALLKLDVQGFELEALKGCASLLPCFSYVYVECSFVELYAGQALAHEVISYVGAFGFALAGIYNMTYDKSGIAVQGDFLFKDKSQPELKCAPDNWR